MGSDPTSAAASLETKFTAFVASLTEAEAAILEAAFDEAGKEVAGFDLMHTAIHADTEVVPTTFLSLSNVLKTRHDTVKNSISNVR
jgi:hypothetical protein